MDKENIESFLKDTWSEILKIPKSDISSESDFFVLGGSSLDVIDIFERLQKYINIDELPMDMFFGEQTIERYIAILSKEMAL